jgi:hypothetical protein
MLLKWLFTLLAIVWLYQALIPFFSANKLSGPSARTTKRKRDEDDDGDYIEYEEIK